MITTIALASAGGYADAASYLLTGSFTGHLTGNTVLAAISLGTANPYKLRLHLLAIILFLTGTVFGLLLLRLGSSRAQALIMALVFEAALVAFAPLGVLSHTHYAGALVVACLCLALGLQNGVFSKSAGVNVHATYITGDVTSLVALVLQRIGPGAHAGLTAEEGEKRRTTIKILGFTWASFIVGALFSVSAVHHFGAAALWLLELPMVVTAGVSWSTIRNVSTNPVS